MPGKFPKYNLNHVTHTGWPNPSFTPVLHACVPFFFLYHFTTTLFFFLPPPFSMTKWWSYFHILWERNSKNNELTQRHPLALCVSLSLSLRHAPRVVCWVCVGARGWFQYCIIGMRHVCVRGQSAIMLPISKAARSPHQLLIAFRMAN